MNKREIVKMFRAIGNERRFAILSNLLSTKELNVGQISELIHLSFKSTSRHLAILADRGLVNHRQVNLNRLYSLSEDFPKELRVFLKK